jgi:DNA polymerase (family 10)
MKVNTQEQRSMLVNCIDLASHIKTIGDLEAMADDANRYKIQAFYRAAQEIAGMATESEVAAVCKAPGVGESTRLIVKEFAETGTSKRFESLAASRPLAALSMTVIRGIGPKTALNLWAEGYHGLDDLLTLAQKNLLPQPWLDRVKEWQRTSGRHPLAVARTLADSVASTIKHIKGVTDVMVCGSIRRQKPFVKDVDIVVQVPNDKDRWAVVQSFLKLGEKVNAGETRAQAKVTVGGLTMPVDIWIVRPDSWGAALNHTTGSKEHNILLRSKAKARGLLVSEYGVFKDDKKVGGALEQDLYRILGMKYVEPKDRR